MAAPSNKYYSPDVITLQKSGYTTKTILMALRGEYALTDAQVKALFKIDVLDTQTKGAANNFVGAVNPLQTNMRYHNSARLSGIKFGNYEMLSDAGLNRKGDALLIKVLNTSTTDYNASVDNYPPRINNARIFYWFYSPIYNAVTGGTIEASYNNTDWTTIGTQGAISSNGEVYSYISDPSFIQHSGNTYFRCRVTNEEGTYVSDVYTADIKMALDVMKYNASQASDAYLYGSTRNVYRNTRAFEILSNSPAIPTRLYKDENTPPTEQDAGYFVLGDVWYSFFYDSGVGYKTITDSGACEAGGYPSGDPANIVHSYSQVDCSGFDRDDLSTAEYEVLSGNYDYRTVYLDTVDNYENNTQITYAYSDSGMTTPSGEGYYVAGDMIMGITRELHINNSGVVDWDTGWL